MLCIKLLKLHFCAHILIENFVSSISALHKSLYYDEWKMGHDSFEVNITAIESSYGSFIKQL